MSGSYARSRAPMSQAFASAWPTPTELKLDPGYDDGLNGRPYTDGGNTVYRLAYEYGRQTCLLKTPAPLQPWERKQ